ncbi:hypothetical protein SAMN05216516_102535, partial [Izhakiella capsodis]
PCKPGWRKVLRAHEILGRDTEFPLLSVLDSNSLEDTIWCMRCLPEYEALWRKYGVWCAAQVEHLMTDDRSKNALRVAWRHSEGLATDEELSTAWAAAEAAALDAAEAAALAVARDARDAADAAALAARDAADAVALAVALAARDAADAAALAVRDAGADEELSTALAELAAEAAALAAGADEELSIALAAEDAQQKKLVEILTAGQWVGGAPWEQ